MKIVQEITREEGIYLANSMNSIRIEGQKTISIETTQQLNWQVPDWVIIPGGNLGNVSALGAGFEMMHKLGLIHSLPKIALAQASNANPLYLSYLKEFKEFKPITAKKTLASAIQIGNPISYKKAIATLEKFKGVVEEASEDDILREAAWFDTFGLYTDPHTAVALTAFKKLYHQNKIKKEDRVVVISTANGLKFTDFKLNFHNQDKKMNPLINQVIKVKPSVSVIKNILNKKI